MATLNTLLPFNGTDGSGPAFGLIMDANGDLAGMTETGGTDGDGTVFELVNTGSGFAAPITPVNFTASRKCLRDDTIPPADSSGDAPTTVTTMVGGHGSPVTRLNDLLQFLGWQFLGQSKHDRSLAPDLDNFAAP
jgi:hypothetical protein